MSEEYQRGFIAGAVVMLFFWLVLEAIYHFVVRGILDRKGKEDAD